MSRRKLRIALTLPLIAAVLAGCGSGQGPGAETAGSASAEQPGASEASERSDRLRKDLVANCLADAPDGGVAPAAPGAPTATASPDGDVPGFAWLDPEAGTSARAALESAVAGARSDLGLTTTVGLRDRTAEETELVGAQQTYPSASLSKVPVALTFVDQLRDAGREPTDQDRALLEDALVRSDNDAATQLHLRLGATELEQAAALQETFDRLGTEHGATAAWPGANPTTSSDQLLILDALQDPPSWLHPDDARLLADLMAVPGPEGEQPDESQAFGVGSLALPLEEPAAENVHVKNGWIDDTYQGTGIWSAGSAGYARVGSTDLDLVIQLDGAPNYDCAFSALDAMAHVSAQTAGS